MNSKIQKGSRVAVTLVKGPVLMDTYIGEDESTVTLKYYGVIPKKEIKGIEKF